MCSSDLLGTFHGLERRRRAGEGAEVLRGAPEHRGLGGEGKVEDREEDAKGQDAQTKRAQARDE